MRKRVCNEVQYSIDKQIESRKTNGETVEDNEDFAGNFAVDNIGTVTFTTTFSFPVSLTDLVVESDKYDLNDLWTIEVEELTGIIQNKSGVSSDVVVVVFR